MPRLFRLTNSISRCPHGEELTAGFVIPISFIGGGAYILRKPGIQPGLGEGSYMATLEILCKKFGFKAELKPAKSVAQYMGNVRTFIY